MSQVLEPGDRAYGVHLTHCCPGHCKYGEVEICPVAQNIVHPKYECEDCQCSVFHPELKPLRWWESLTLEQQANIYEANK